MKKAIPTAIVGFGVVGQALAEVLSKPIIYDPPKKMGSLKKLNNAEVIFICVPTAYKNKCDISLVDKSISILTGNKIVVIKSTVVPGTTEKMQKKYPQHKILFNPEFLTANNSKKDMKKPDRQIVGYVNDEYELARDILDILPKAPYEAIVSATEAEMIKYYTNTFLALKVAYANQVYDLCQKIGIDYEIVKKGLLADHRIGKTHLDIFVDGLRGFRGACLPKDSKALVKFAEQKRVKFNILKEAIKYNNKLWTK